MLKVIFTLINILYLKGQIEHVYVCIYKIYKCKISVHICCPESQFPLPLFCVAVDEYVMWQLDTIE